MNKSLAAIALGVALIGSSTIAQADTLVSYNLVGVTFADGGFANGTFTVDWSTDAVTALDISTTPGSIFVTPLNFGLSNVVYETGSGNILLPMPLISSPLGSI